MKILSERKRSIQFEAVADGGGGSLPAFSVSSTSTPEVKGQVKPSGSVQYSSASGHKDVKDQKGLGPTMSSSPPEIYHEKQVRALCALHALNNLFQGPDFNKRELDSVCDRLAPDAWPLLNPHKSALGLGNYDINVIMTALQVKGYEAVWFDKRKDPSTLNLPAIYGFIFNVPTDCKVGWISLPLKRKHWYAVRAFEQDFYNLDSKLEAPVLIGKADALLAFFREELQSKDKELFLVINQCTSQTQQWNLACQGQHLTLPDGDHVTTAVRKESADSGVVELLDKEPDLNIVDLNNEVEEEERRFS